MSNKKFFIAVFGLLAIRIFFSRLTGVWFPTNQHFDDELMISYANFYQHFINHSEIFNETLIKNIGFPVFLNLSGEIGLVYTDALSLLWFFAALLSVVLFYKVTEITKKSVWLMIYAFVLFTPAAFDSWCGTRLYRNAVLAPLYFIVLNMTAIIFVKHFDSVKINLLKFFPYQVALGLFLTLTFYVKEDGVWILAVLIFVLIVCLIKNLLQKNFSIPYKFFHLCILILPLIIFWCGTNFYKDINYKYFGVREINTRTEGEVGKFVKSVYKIKSDERTGKIWAPADAVQKAFDASETLKNNPKLRDAVFYSPWFRNNIFENQIHGDFLGWVLLTAVRDSGTCTTLAEQENYFKKVNAELDAAFANGTLEKDSKIQLVSSMGGRSFIEILKLSKLVIQAYGIHISLYEYIPGSIPAQRLPPQNEQEELWTNTAINLTHINLLEQNENSELMNALISILFIIYGVGQTVLFIFGFIGTCWGIFKIVKKEISFSDKLTLAVLIATGIFLLAIIYAVAISWFCEFISPSELRHFALKFYSIGLIPMFMSFEIFGMYLFYRKG